MATKLIDTDIAIDHFHGHQAALDFLTSALATGETLAISVVTIAEIASGMRAGEEERTERLISMFVVFEIDERIARHAGDYLRGLRASHRIELGDAFIAATALVHEAELVTRNLKHYPMKDIRITTPYERGRR